MRRLLLCLTVTLGLCLGLGTTAHAAPTTTADGAPAPSAQLRAELREAAIALRSYDRATGTVDAAAALAAGASPQTVRDLRAGLAWGERHAAATRALSPQAQQAQLAACSGRTAFHRKLTYVEIWMDSCDVRAVIGLMTAGGGAAAIAGAIISLTGIGIPVGVALAIAGGLLAIGSGALQVCARYGRGVVLDNLGWPCRSQ